MGILDYVNVVLTSDTNTLCAHRSLECNIRAGVAHTRIIEIEALATLFVSDPLQARVLGVLFQCSQCSEQDPDRMSPTDSVLCPLKVVREVMVGQ